MATFEAQGSGTTGASSYTLRLVVNEDSYSISNNTSNVSWALYLISTGYNFSTWSFPIYAYVDGEVYNVNTYRSLSKNSTLLIGSGSKTISHNSDGTKSIWVEASVSATGAYYLPGNIYVSGTVNLTNIPRYANITRFDVQKKDETSVKFLWSTDATCDYAWYSKDNGSTWEPYNIADGTSGEFNVSGLTANTYYTFKLRIRRKDSQLSIDSSSSGQTTYDYPKPTTINNFTIGNGGNIVYLDNPLRRNCTLQAISNQNGAVIATYTGTSSGYIGAEFVTQSAIDAQYASIPDSKSGTYYVKVTYSGHVKTSGNATYSIRNTEVPTFNNWTYADVNSTTVALTGNNQTIIKGYSKIRGTITTSNKMVANYSSNPSSYKLMIGSNSTQSNYSSSSSVNVGDLTATSNNFFMYAVDSRGLSTSVEKDAVTYKQYSDIRIINANVERQDKVGSQTTLTLQGSIWNNNFGNRNNSIKTFKIAYSIPGETSEYREVTVQGSPTVAGQAFSYIHTINGDLGASGYTITKPFNIKITVSDELSTAQTILTLGAGTPNLAIAKEGVAINKPFDPELSSVLQVNGGLDVTGKGIIRGDLDVNGILKFPNNKFIETGGAIDLSNSDIINTNSIWMNDESTGSEGINFLKQNGDRTNPEDYENLRGYRGNLYYNNNLIIAERSEEYFYRANETFTFANGIICPGHVTSSTTRVDFCFTLPRSIKFINSIVFTGGTVTVRGVSGYLDDSYANPIPLTGSSTYTSTIAKIENNLIRVEIQKTSTFTNVSNNTPLTVHFNSVKMKFT